MNRSATAPARSPPQPPPGATTPQRRPSRPRHASQLQTVRAVVKRVLLVSQTSAMASISNQELGEVQGLYPDQRRCGRRSESVGANTILASPGGRGSRTPRSNGPSARWEHVTARAIPLDARTAPNAWRGAHNDICRRGSRPIGNRLQDARRPPAHDVRSVSRSAPARARCTAAFMPCSIIAPVQPFADLSYIRHDAPAPTAHIAHGRPSPM
jgi:hypothetical protein